MKAAKVWHALHWDESRDARELSDCVGLERGRTCEQLRACVRHLRELGLPVVSSGDGYKKSTSPAALARCAQDFNRRADSLRQKADRLLKLIEQGWGPTAYEEEARRVLGQEYDD